MSRHHTRPPLDVQVARALAEQRDDIVIGLRAEQIAEIRSRAEPPDLDGVRLGGHFAITHLDAGGPSGPPTPLVVLRPVDAPQGVATLYFVHGGGLVAGSAHDALPWAAELAAATGCAVVSCEYRLAPEHPYPAAIDDVHDGFAWVVENAGALGADPRRVVLVGVSAGGGLAAAAALRSRDRGGPRALGQLLVCPMLDDRNDTGSAWQMSGAGSWDRTANATGWRAYLPEVVGGPDVPADASPARAAGLGGLPPAFVDVGSAETFRDEAVEYARRIWLDGGEAELHVWPGGVHGFDFLAPHAELSLRARAARVGWLRRLLTTAS